MSTNLSAGEREDLRKVVLAYLAARSTGAFDAAQIRATLLRRRDLDFAPKTEDVEAAALFLVGKTWARKVDSEFGAATPYQVTADGVLQAERHGLC